ncbi:uncharacterized protein LOC130091946 [Rhinichthys klamathensis goyatoka]|uniref:uncharacterized protein LOC130091946 n=1 Tax=Rhinichthys klamathensis goyatoka TaxID=3034132 RepID=UPI0024B5E006|nr:uncharacterized protein LOC130091946 [Rhinichthys klamathensis goyatoka]
MSSRKQWTQDLEQNLIELWQEHECLYDVGHEMYHNRSEKEKRWTEITNALKQPEFTVEDIKTRAVSLRTQYCCLQKPKPSGSGCKPLTPRQRWLLRVMDFIKTYIVHRPCETTLGASFSGQSDAEDMDLSDLRPDTPSVDSSPRTASTPIPSNQEAFTLSEETASTASSDSGKQPRLSNNPQKKKEGVRGCCRAAEAGFVETDGCSSGLTNTSGYINFFWEPGGFGIEGYSRPSSVITSKKKHNDYDIQRPGE